ncbi:MAG TPA: ATP-grasp domain-containing protein [Methylomirabilota bacterium]|jgi:carbamoyl-phosphate synthase large subunit|nr:ATP-grasp domain-containing protein [Methylomirabilota bacterium]
MSRTVLVPGAGGAAAVSAIKSLRIAEFDGRIISTDADPLSAGFYLADGFRVVPKAKDPEFYAEVKRLIADEGIDVILPTSGFDIYEFARHKQELQAAGVVVAMSDLHAMTTCANKWEFYLKTHGAFPLPETSRDLGRWQRFPCFVKPVFGKGSRNSYRCDTRAELAFYSSRFRDLIVQEYLPGEEYTVDVLSDLAATPILAVPRIRLETKDGISSKGRIVRDSEMEQLCLEIAAHLGLKGPTCMQLKRDEQGRLKFLEINPRIGGGSIFSTLAGVNIPKLLLDIIDGMELAPRVPKEILVLRYYEEVVLDARSR